MLSMREQRKVQGGWWHTFEKCVKVGEATGDTDGIAHAKANIAVARSTNEDDNNEEELLKMSREFYELRVVEFGEEYDYTIDAGIDLPFSY